MSKPTLNLNQFITLNEFLRNNNIDQHRIDYAQEFHKGCVEVRGRADDKGWRPIGREVYCWISREGEILGSAARVMADGGPAPRAGEMGRKTAAVGHYRRLNGEMAEVMGKSFFTVSKDIGVVPTVREQIIKYIENEKE